MVQRITSWLWAALALAVPIAIIPLAFAAGGMYAGLLGRHWGMAFRPWDVAIFVGVSAAILVIALALAATVVMIARNTALVPVLVLLIVGLAMLGAIAAGVWYLLYTHLRESWLYALPYIAAIIVALAAAAIIVNRKSAPPKERKAGGATKTRHA